MKYEIHILDIIGNDKEHKYRDKFDIKDKYGNNNKETGEYTYNNYEISIYGKTSEKQSSIVNVTNYNPFFFLKIPLTWSEKYFCKLFKNILYPSEQITILKENGKTFKVNTIMNQIIITLYDTYS